MYINEGHITNLEFQKLFMSSNDILENVITCQGNDKILDVTITA